MTKVIVVYGKPRCGKTTYVKNHIKDNDIVFDYDALFSALSFKEQHETARDCQFRMLMDFRRCFLLNMKKCGADNAYIIVTNPANIQTWLPHDAIYISPNGGEPYYGD